ncbi:MAG: ATP-binding protein, partial [Candidatus Saccharimonadales bacterium]
MELILPKPGRYLVAVSGGLDSVCLLDILATNPDYELSVAHFDHGIRVDSSSDCKFVESLARKYRLPFLSDEGKLGPNASESVAR